MTVCASGNAKGLVSTLLSSIEIENWDADVPGGVQRCNAAARDAIFVKALKTFEHEIATIAADHPGMSCRKHHLWFWAKDAEGDPYPQMFNQGISQM